MNTYYKTVIFLLFVFSSGCVERLDEYDHYRIAAIVSDDQVSSVQLTEALGIKYEDIYKHPDDYLVALDDYIDFTLISQEVARKRMYLSFAMVTEFIQLNIKKAGTYKEFLRQTGFRNKTDKYIWDYYKADLATRNLFDRYPDLVKNYKKIKNKDRHYRVIAREILVKPVDNNDWKQATETANTIADMIKQGFSYDVLVGVSGKSNYVSIKETSKMGYMNNGLPFSKGQLDFLSEDQEKVLFSLKVNEVGGPVKSTKGYHFYFVTKRIVDGFDSDVSDQRYAEEMDYRSKKKAFIKKLRDTNYIQLMQLPIAPPDETPVEFQKY